LSNNTPPFQRPQAAVLRGRLAEPRRFLQAVCGPRQVGKSTLVQQVVEGTGLPTRWASADEPSLRGGGWLGAQWEAARAETSGGDGILVIDEIHKVPEWAETVKRLWDEDTRARRRLRVVLLGSAPLLVERGLAEALTGRFETLRLPHWSFPEMHEAFGFDLDRHVFYGGYPGAAPLVDDPERWRRYVLDSLVETSIGRDVLLLTRVDKPALLRRTFELGCRCSGQILSYTKMLGELHDAGNTTTLAHYLRLLEGAGLLRALSKHAGGTGRRRASIPKLQVFNNALVTAVTGLRFDEARADGGVWGRLVESAVGAHLVNAAATEDVEVGYWREGDREVDFVLGRGRTTVAVEVKTGKARGDHAGLDAFLGAHPRSRPLLIGGDGIPVDDFLRRPVRSWVE
jgi:predicted AAA+ superfamily ATPase